MTGHLAVLGDSWTDPRDPDARLGRGWPQQVAGRLGMGLAVSGVGGSGYASRGGGDLDSTYPEQAARGTAVGAAAAVVWGSVNDRGWPLPEVYAGAVETYRLLRLALAPGAPLLVYGPQWWDTEPEGSMAPLRDTVHRAAAEAGALFVDPMDWFRDRLHLLDGTAHPGGGGYDLIADRVTTDLLWALITRPAAEGSPSPATGGWALPLEVGAASQSHSPPALPMEES